MLYLLLYASLWAGQRGSVFPFAHRPLYDLACPITAGTPMSLSPTPPADPEEPQEEAPHTPLFYELKEWIDRHLEEKDDESLNTSSARQTLPEASAKNRQSALLATARREVGEPTHRVAHQYLE